jgi:hypothetical protein
MCRRQGFAAGVGHLGRGGLTLQRSGVTEARGVIAEFSRTRAFVTGPSPGWLAKIWASEFMSKCLVTAVPTRRRFWRRLELVEAVTLAGEGGQDSRGLPAQQRTQLLARARPVPDGVVLCAGELRNRMGEFGVGRQPTVRGWVGAQDVGQHERVPGVGFLRATKCQCRWPETASRSIATTSRPSLATPPVGSRLVSCDRRRPERRRNGLRLLRAR